MRTNQLLTAAALVFATGSASAAVISGDALTGTVIAPDATIEVVASGATPIETLNALGDLRVLQTFTGVSGPDNIFDFTSSPDLRITYTGSVGTVNAVNNGSFTTSGSSAMRVEGGGASDLVVTIDFGAYEAGSGSFDNVVSAVAAAGFTLTASGQWSEVTGVTAQFLTDAGAVLSTQSITTTTEGSHAYFGYQSTAGNIGYVQFTVSFIDPGDGTFGNGPLGLDDIATSQIPVPEPASLALLGLGGLALLRRRG